VKRETMPKVKKAGRPPLPKGKAKGTVLQIRFLTLKNPSLRNWRKKKV
jgi:hypothetical protein